MSFFYSNSLDLNFIQSALKRLFCPFLASRVDVSLAQALTPVDALRVCTRLRLLTTVVSSGSSYIFFHLLRLIDCQSLIRIFKKQQVVRYTLTPTHNYYCFKNTRSSCSGSHCNRCAQSTYSSATPLNCSVERLNDVLLYLTPLSLKLLLLIVMN